MRQILNLFRRTGRVATRLPVGAATNPINFSTIATAEESKKLNSAKNKFSGLIRFCPRSIEEFNGLLKEINPLKKILSESDSAMLQITHLPGNRDNLYQTLSRLITDGIDPARLMPHVSIEALKDEDEYFFEKLDALRIKQIFLISGVRMTGSMLSKEKPGEYYRPEHIDVVIRVLKEAKAEIPGLKIALPFYPDSHVLTVKSAYKGGDTLRIEVENLLQKVATICDALDVDPNEFISRIIFQHSFNPHNVETAVSALREMGVEIPIFATAMNPGNAKTALALSKERLVEFNKQQTTVFYKLLNDLLANSYDDKAYGEILNKANQETRELVTEFCKYADGVIIYDAKAHGNLKNILPAFGIEDRPSPEVSESSYSKPNSNNENRGK